MKTRVFYPGLESVSLEEFLDKVPFSNLMALFLDISEFYNVRIDMFRVLNAYGVHDVTSYSDEVQVPCLLVEHGSQDTHNSARYFQVDRTSGEKRGSVYCYKCQKLLTSFWYIFKMEKDLHGLGIKEIYLHIKKRYGIDFPRDLVLDFDPETFYTFNEEYKEREVLIESFKKAESLRNLKDQDFYYSELKKIFLNG